MQKDLLRLKHLRDSIIGIEMQLSMVDRDLFAVNKDIAYLSDLEGVLVENIKILKSDKIIAIASEFKRSIEELKKVRENLAFYSGMKIKLEKKAEKFEKMKIVYLEDFRVMKNLLDSSKVILLFDPSRKKNT
jgi:hypothetical protein